jgi:hypothetical protein
LEQELQPLRKLAKSADMQSKLTKDINNSVKQLGKQIVQIQKAIQKDKGGGRGTGTGTGKTRGRGRGTVIETGKTRGRGRGRGRGRSK